ncbi:hypothetical protein SNK03_008002 [Fusarium graminearum]
MGEERGDGHEQSDHGLSHNRVSRCIRCVRYVPIQKPDVRRAGNTSCWHKYGDSMAGLGRAGAMIWTVTRDSNTNLDVPLVLLFVFGEERESDRRETWKDI